MMGIQPLANNIHNVFQVCCTNNCLSSLLDALRKHTVPEMRKLETNLTGLYQAFQPKEDPPPYSPTPDSQAGCIPTAPPPEDENAGHFEVKAQIEQSPDYTMQDIISACNDTSAAFFSLLSVEQDENIPWVPIAFAWSCLPDFFNGGELLQIHQLLSLQTNHERYQILQGLEPERQSCLFIKFIEQTESKRQNATLYETLEILLTKTLRARRVKIHLSKIEEVSHQQQQSPPQLLDWASLAAEYCKAAVAKEKFSKIFLANPDGITRDLAEKTNINFLNKENIKTLDQLLRIINTTVHSDAKKAECFQSVISFIGRKETETHEAAVYEAVVDHLRTCYIPPEQRLALLFLTDGQLNPYTPDWEMPDIEQKYEEDFHLLMDILAKNLSPGDGGFLAIHTGGNYNDWTKCRENHQKSCATSMQELIQQIHTRAGSYQETIALIKKGLEKIPRNDLLSKYKPLLP